MSSSTQSFISRFFATIRTLLLTGIALWLPLIITFWVLHLLVTSIDGLQEYLPISWQPSNLLGRDIPGFGILLVVLILLITGFFARNFIGKKIIALWEDIFDRIPIVKSVYRSVKQVSDNLFSGKAKAFREAVMVEFPRDRLWTIAFVTCQSAPPHLENQATESEWLGLYVPTTPNPTGGYFIWVKREETRAIDISVEDALKLLLSLGMITNENI